MFKKYKDPKQELIEKEACPRCKREHVMKESPRTGQYFCSHCGYISPFAYIDETSEFRNFAVDHGVKDKSRSSNAGDDIVEVLGTGVAYDGTARAKEMNRFQQRVMSQQDPQISKLKRHVHQIKNLGGLLQLSKLVIERACKIFKEALDLNLTENKKGEAFDAACIYYACLSSGIYKTMKEILPYTENVSSKEFDKAINIVKGLPSLQTVDTDWEESIKQYCPMLNLPTDVQDACYQVAKYLKSAGILEGKMPLTRVAAVIAYVCNNSPDQKDHRTFEEIQLVVGPKKETIQQRVNDIQNVPLKSLPAFQELLKKQPTI